MSKADEPAAEAAAAASSAPSSKRKPAASFKAAAATNSSVAAAAAAAESSASSVASASPRSRRTPKKSQAQLEADAYMAQDDEDYEPTTPSPRNKRSRAGSSSDTTPVQTDRDDSDAEQDDDEDDEDYEPQGVEGEEITETPAAAAGGLPILKELPVWEKPKFDAQRLACEAHWNSVAGKEVHVYGRGTTKTSCDPQLQALRCCRLARELGAHVVSVTLEIAKASRVEGKAGELIKLPALIARLKPGQILLMSSMSRIGRWIREFDQYHHSIVTVKEARLLSYGPPHPTDSSKAISLVEHPWQMQRRLSQEAQHQCNSQLLSMRTALAEYFAANGGHTEQTKQKMSATRRALAASKTPDERQQMAAAANAAKRERRKAMMAPMHAANREKEARAAKEKYEQMTAAARAAKDTYEQMTAEWIATAAGKALSAEKARATQLDTKLTATIRKNVTLEKELALANSKIAGLEAANGKEKAALAEELGAMNDKLAAANSRHAELEAALAAARAQLLTATYCAISMQAAMQPSQQQQQQQQQQ